MYSEQRHLQMKLAELRESADVLLDLEADEAVQLMQEGLRQYPKGELHSENLGEALHALKTVSVMSLLAIMKLEFNSGLYASSITDSAEAARQAEVLNNALRTVLPEVLGDLVTVHGLWPEWGAIVNLTLNDHAEDDHAEDQTTTDGSDSD